MSSKDAGWHELIMKLQALESNDFSKDSTAACAAFELIKEELKT